MRKGFSRTKEGARFINFTQAFRTVYLDLATAYTVPEDLYAQPASMARFEHGISINSAKEFLAHVQYDPDKAAGIVEDFAKARRLSDIGINIGAEEFLRVGPDAKVNGRSLTIAALAQRAARLESLLTPIGIPDAYVTAQTQTRQALNVLERAARLACDWSPSWGRLNVETALAQARGTGTRQKVAQATMVGILALTGCYMPVTPIPDLIPGITPTATEVVPAIMETLAPTVTATIEPTLTEIPTQAPTETSTETLAPTPEGPTEFSEKYPPEWSERYMANVGGMEIPISIGLTRWVRNRPEYPISEIHIAPDIVDKVGDYYMHMCFWRYSRLMGHPDVTYDQYLELVAKGEGQIEIATHDDTRTDQTFPEVSLIDPREGFSLVFADQALEIKLNQYSFYYGSSANRLLMVYNLMSSTEVEQTVYKNCGYSEKVCKVIFAQNKITTALSNMGFLENRCLLKNDVIKSCPRPHIPSEFSQFKKELVQGFNDYINGSRETPPFWIVEP